MYIGHILALPHNMDIPSTIHSMISRDKARTPYVQNHLRVCHKTLSHKQCKGQGHLHTNIEFTRALTDHNMLRTFVYILNIT